MTKHDDYLQSDCSSKYNPDKNNALRTISLSPPNTTLPETNIPQQPSHSSGDWHLSQTRTLRLKAGDTISIPALAYHRFENAPDSAEPLTFGYWYMAEYTVAEQRFFRDRIGYIADCERAGPEVSVVQLCVFFLAELDCYWGCELGVAAGLGEFGCYTVVYGFGCGMGGVCSWV